MGPEVRLLIVEQILEPDPVRGRPTSYLVDTQMLAMFGSARERTQSEFGVLLAASACDRRADPPLRLGKIRSLTGRTLELRELATHRAAVRLPEPVARAAVAASRPRKLI